MRNLPAAAKPTDRTETGAALVIVLSILLLIAALLIAFMSSSRNDLAATTQYAAGQEAAAIAETATSLVLAQIREATLAGINGQGRGTFAWASQPGAIRVWNNQGQPATPFLYKLYSAARMKENDLSFLPDEIPADWRTQSAAYTDVNEPVSRSGKWTYPVLDPAAIGNVQGFSSALAADPSVPWDARCSMPVRWLYIGRDGSISNTVQPGSVGRVAFWTDDETCKVNINTASAGADESPIRSTRNSPASQANRLGASFWSVPYTALMQDYNYGSGNPSQDEFQRYAGHPASVNLLPVLQGPAFTTLSETQRLNVLKNLFDIFPRYRWGGSENQRTTYTNPRTDISGANQKQSRLYASVDELGFAPGLNGDLRATTVLPAAVGGSGPAPTDQERLDIWRFFLTATSRAPDTNLFGQPRVCLWPVSGNNDPLHRTTQDNLIAFCSTVGQGNDAREYFFQRLYPFSQTADWTEFPRNKEIFEFLQRSTSNAIPGFGGNFRAKYDTANGGVAGERDQILTAMFDTIRIANLNETFPGRPVGFRSYTPDSRTVAADVSSPPYPGSASTGGAIAGAGTVFPILTDYGRGAGRIPVVSELALYLIHRGTGASLDPTPTDKILSAFFIETFTPTLGFMPWTPRDFQASLASSVTVESLPVFTGSANGSGLVTATSVARNRDTDTSSRQPVGGTNGFWDLGFTLQAGKSPNMFNIPGNVHFGRSFAQAIPAPNPEISVGAGAVEIALKMQDSTNVPTTYQTYSLMFPAATLPKPNPVVPTATGDGGDWQTRNLANTHLAAKPEDVVRSLVPRDGDLRIVAYLQDVPEQFFRPHPDFTTSKHFAHSIRFRKNFGWRGAIGDLSDGTTNGQLVGLPYFRDFGSASLLDTTEPDIPPDITDLVGRGWEGDWNNGIGDFPDGAYLHKPDEGMTRSNFAAPNYFDPYTWSPASGFYSPTQAMPSAIVFGSIPTAVLRTADAYRNNNFSQGRPWRTLLFCPNPDFEISGSSGSRHYGASDPPDYLLADLFNMPVVEPYAISEPLSTAGRINMNYQILPFTGIKRTTGLYALFSGQRVSAIPNSLSRDANRVTPSQNDNTRIHHEIDVEQTLRQFEDRFAAGSLFRSAAEICSIFYVPAGQTLAGIRGWWADKRMTGDNLRERPYMTTYPLLTTRSNTYTVHIRAQSLVAGTTKVTGEYRGSATVERYVDPADERIGSAAPGGVDPDTQSLEPLYRFRVIDTKRFAP